MRQFNIFIKKSEGESEEEYSNIFEDLFSPLGMVHYHYYKSNQDLNNYLSLHNENIQAVVGHGFIPFGNAQKPTLNDYADGVDTMHFLNSL